ncbi:hypothetical protein MJT46_009628 [Ovis ammon polii x Ovis aries]|nr:hypothetical protein MJT46_009628 [Ovis ammon polii x Ovis aries]
MQGSFVLEAETYLVFSDQCDSRNKWMNEYPYEEENNKGWFVKLYNCSGSPILNLNLGQLFSLVRFFDSEAKNINTLENRMLMLDGMPAVRVKTELLESEQGNETRYQSEAAVSGSEFSSESLAVGLQWLASST